jgi:hypothetical protein
MSLLTPTELKTLAEKREGPFVSIFMPTHRLGAETEQNRIRLKNLVKEAETRLVEYGLRRPEARTLLQPARIRVDDSTFWQRQSDGLGMFLAPDFSRTYHLPLNFEELLVVANAFHLKPLLPLLKGDGRFYILALSQNDVRLFQGSRYTVNKVDIKNMPESLSEALWYEDPQKQQQFHTGTPGGQGERPAMFHGQGVGVNDTKDTILRYFHQIDRGLQKILKNEQAPLVLASVAYLFPIYREANTYPHLVEESIAGNPETMNAEELHRRAWTVVEPFFQQPQQEAMARYHELANTEKTSRDIREIVPAAHYGRVDTLFVAVGYQQWGYFESDTDTIHLHAEAESGDEDLLDAAAVQTFLHGGAVYAMQPENVPDRVPLAAIFRF